MKRFYIVTLTAVLFPVLVSVYSCSGKDSGTGTTAKDNPGTRENRAAAPGTVNTAGKKNTGGAGLPQHVLERLEAAVVFVKVGYDNKQTSGAGFLFHTEKENGFILTNAHTVVDRRQSPREGIFVVFNSGTIWEKIYGARVICSNITGDAALLKITGSDFPAPLDIEKTFESRGAEPVYTLGFPPWKGLTVKQKGNPTVIVGTGTTADIRRHENGNFSYVRIAGDMQKGSPGGPVVDAKGTFIGILVSKFEKRGFGAAIPAGSLRHLLEGRVENIRIVEKSNSGGTAAFSVFADVVDPLKSIRRVGIAVLPEKSCQPPYPSYKDGSYHKIASSLGDYASFKRRSSEAKMTLKVKGKAGTAARAVYQVCYIDSRNVVRFLEPSPFQFVLKEGPPETVRPAPPSPPARENRPGKKEDGPGVTPETPKTPKTPVTPVTASKKKIVQDSRRLGDAAVSTIDLPVGLLTGDLEWSPGAKGFYALNRRGVIYHVSVPGLNLIKEYDLEGGASAMGMSGEGLVVVLDNHQEVRLLSPVKLETKGTIPSPGAYCLAVSPNSGVAFVTRRTNPRELTVIDLKNKRVADVVEVNRVPGNYKGSCSALTVFDVPTVTPDGKYLFVMSDDALHRFRIRGATLSYDGFVPSMATSYRKISIGPDSRYISPGSGSRGPRDNPEIGRFPVYVYRVNALGKPVTTFTTGGHVQAVGFDKAAKMLYAYNLRNQLITVGIDGRVKKEYSFDFFGDQTRRFLVHPSGKKMLILTQKKLLWVELD